MSNRDVVRNCLLAMRQLANSDGVKRSLAAHGGIEALLSVLSAHAEVEDVVEASLGLLANMTLRQPEVSAWMGGWMKLRVRNRRHHHF